MRALFRVAAFAVAGAALYYAGLLNSIVIQRPERPGAIAVVVAIGAALVMAGALTFFALPARRLALVARRGRAA